MGKKRRAQCRVNEQSPERKKAMQKQTTSTVFVAAEAVAAVDHTTVDARMSLTSVSAVGVGNDGRHEGH